MRQLTNRFSRSESFLAFVFSFATLFLLYPRLFLGLDYVMGQGIWELQDPAVSPLYFVPSGRMLRHELFTNGWNFLWSSTRGYGQPILGNDIQTAPLFPLTILLRWLPDPYFWQSFVLIRLVLLGGFCFLFARQILNRSKTGAWVFMLCFGFAVHVLRWTNHAWQTGLLSDVMYLYFCSKLIQEFPAFRLRIGLGVVLSTYCVITSGFPEASVMGGFLALFILLPQIFSRLKTLKGFLGFSILFLTLNLIGLLLGSPQLLGMYELLETSVNSVAFRAGPGVAQFESFSIFWSLITRITEGPPRSAVIHFFNLIPLFLFVVGLVGYFSKKRLEWSFAAAATCFYFYIFKNFKVWPWFNHLVGTLPLLSTIWFFVYFLPILLFPFAYFASLGADTLKDEAFRRKQTIIFYLFLAAALVFVLVHATTLEPNTSLSRTLRLLVLFLGFIASVSVLKKNWLSLVLVAFLLGELSTVRPIHYMKFKDGDYHSQFSDNLTAQLKALLLEKGLNPIEMRDRSAGGTFAEAGITSMNNGSAPVIPPRPSAFINTLFRTWVGWGAAMPVLGENFPYSYRLVSNNLQVIENADPNFGLKDNREWQLLGKLGTFYVFHDPFALPRAYLADRCMTAKEPAEALSLISNPSVFSLGNGVLENLTGDDLAFCKSYRRSNFEKVPLLNDRGSSLALTKIRGPAVLMLNDLYYPDWKVTDKTTSEAFSIKPGNYNFRGVVLKEARDYELVFEYQPRWLPLAKRLVLFGLALLCFVIFYSLKAGARISPHSPLSHRPQSAHG